MGERIVAELGRPETPEETAQRKAEASRTYRSSQTFRNLIAAMLVTLAVVAVVIAIVPRGELTSRETVDVAAESAALAETYGRPVIDPELPEGWIVNSAQVEGDSVAAFTVLAASPDDSGYLRIAQGFEADAAWVSRTLSGATPAETVELGGVEWERYVIANPSDAKNVSYALATDAGVDTVLIYGSSARDAADEVAADLAPQVERLRAESAS